MAAPVSGASELTQVEPGGENHRLGAWASVDAREDEEVEG